MKKEVLDAFLAVRDGYSADVVIANPQLNQEFILACRTRGLAHPDASLNGCLHNMRKARDLSGFPTSRRATIRNQDEYRFASEIAARFLERRDHVSLDQILCDPVRAAQFDEVAARIAPGFSSFQYRWAALNLRKRKRLKPELLSRVVAAETISTCKVTELKLGEIPIRPGLYLFFDAACVLYVGECMNLRKRIGKHLEHSDNRGFARWLWEHGAGDLSLECHVLPTGVPTRVRKALETELIRSRKPIFNIAGAEPTRPE